MDTVIKFRTPSDAEVWVTMMNQDEYNDLMSALNSLKAANEIILVRLTDLYQQEEELYHQLEQEEESWYDLRQIHIRFLEEKKQELDVLHARIVLAEVYNENHHSTD